MAIASVLAAPDATRVDAAGGPVPAASLASGDAAGHGGVLGSSCTRRGDRFSCLDVPPPRRLSPRAFDPGGTLTLRVDPGWALEGWTVSYRTYAEHGGRGPSHRLDRGRVGGRDGVRAVSFDAPPSGDWWVEAVLGFHGRQGRGDATYHWRLTSPPETALAAGEGPSLALLAAAGAVPLTLLGGSFVLRRRVRGRFAT